MKILTDKMIKEMFIFPDKKSNSSKITNFPKINKKGYSIINTIRRNNFGKT